LNGATLLANWKTVLSHPTFRSCALLSALTYAGMVVVLVAAPFIFIQVLGLTRIQFGVAILSNACVFIAGTFLCRRLLAQRGLRGTVAIGGALSLASGVLLAGFTWAGLATAWTLIPAVWLYGLSFGIHQACSQAGSVAPFPRMAGVASALNGCITMTTAFLVGGWVSRHMDGSIGVMTYGVLLSTIPLALVAWTLMQKHGEVQPA
jgi:DHA1 family bicyclomycin/chloramphenicol resistance-like MFS transporter